MKDHRTSQTTAPEPECWRTHQFTNPLPLLLRPVGLLTAWDL